MLDLREHKKNPDRLSDLLNWAAFIAPTVLLNKDGSLQTTLKYRGPDLDSATRPELLVVTARLNDVLKRLGSGWALFAEARRDICSEYPEATWDSPVGYLIDEERRKLFSGQKHFESNYYLTLLYLPPEDSTEKFIGKFLVGNGEVGQNYHRILESYESEVQRLVDLCERIFPEVQVLRAEETLAYLHSTISNTNHRIVLPEVPMYLDSYLADETLTAGLSPKLGESFLGVLSVLGYPGSSHPGMLDTLNRLDIKYRWTTRFLPLDKQDATKQLDNYKRKWFAKRKGIGTLIREMMTREESALTNSEALDKANDADEALRELGADDVSYGYFTTTLVLTNEDRESLRTDILKARKAINGLGFVTKLETVNAVDAWLGSIPGNPRNNVRRPLLNTLNLVHLLPGTSAVWAGPEKNTHLDAPPLLYSQTNGSTPFRFVTHFGDVGHTLILGPTGAGKSTLLALMEAQFLRYKNAQVYIFDKGGSARALTYGVGGDYYELATENCPIAFQPLGDIDDENERKWAQGYILDILGKENIEITPLHKKAVWAALTSLSDVPKEQRTMYGLTVHLQDHDLRRALEPYTHKGPWGKLLDSQSDNLRNARWQCFEMETLMETPQAVLPVLSYLFRRLQQRFTGNPTMLVLDEAWLFLDHPAFAAKIREWLKVLRKSNVMVVFATQSLADVERSTLAPIIKEACFTKIYLPNTAALQPDAKEFYNRFGLNETQIQILAHSYPKRDYYYTSPLGNRLFSLGLGPVALAYCGNSKKEAQVMLANLRQQFPDLYDYNHAFLEKMGLHAEAELFEEVKEGREAA